MLLYVILKLCKLRLEVSLKGFNKPSKNMGFFDLVSLLIGRELLGKVLEPAHHEDLCVLAHIVFKSVGADWCVSLELLL